MLLRVVDATDLRAEVVPGVVAVALVDVVTGHLLTTPALLRETMIRRRRFSKQSKQLSLPAQLKRFEAARSPADGAEKKGSVF